MSVVLGLGALIWQACWFYSTPRLGRLFYPANAAIFVIDQWMDYAEAVGSGSLTERVLGTAYNMSPDNATNECLHICDDVIVHLGERGYSSEAQSEIRSVRAMLLAEAGRTNELSHAMTELDRTVSGRQTTRLLRMAYLSEGLGDEPPIFSSGDQLFTSKWARDRMRLRLADRLGRSEDARAVSAEARHRAKDGMALGRRMLALQLVGIMTGLWCCVRSVRRCGLGLWSPPSSGLAPWHFRDGIAVLFFVEALVLVAAVGLSQIPTVEAQFVATCGYMLVPAILTAIVVHVALIRPNGLGFGSHFDFVTSGNGIRRIAGGAIVLFGLGFVGSLMLHTLLGKAGIHSPWADRVNEYLLFGTRGQRAMVLLNMSIIGPFYEELLMRGVLFGTLRSHFRFLPAALISSAAFAALHFYSPAGFASVMWFGFVAALVYERTKSLLACISGHMLTNLFLGTWQLMAAS